VKTRKRETFARKTKRNVTRKMFGRNVSIFVIDVKTINIHAM